MIRAVICDLDGPILDCRRRHYECYSSVLKDLGQRPLDAKVYWELKRHGASWRALLEKTGSGTVAEPFHGRWASKIESFEMLELDRVWPSAISTLEMWRSRQVHMILATMRQSAENLGRQLKSKGLDGFWEGIVVSAHLEGGLGKSLGVQKKFPSLRPEGSLWIGDSEIDLEAARHFGCRAWFVNCGVRDISVLHAIKPDHSSEDLSGVDLEKAGAYGA